jgi:acyl-CoA thioesterase FadM
VLPQTSRKIGVTANLEPEYKSPISVGSLVVIRAETTEVQGRKAWVRATIEDATDGTICVEGKDLFVEPRWATEIAQDDMSVSGFSYPAHP